MALLSVQNVSKTFEDHHYKVHAVREVSLDVDPGEMIAIIGPSGSGKTTLLNVMGLVISPDCGEIYIDGKKASAMNDRARCAARNQYFGYIVQDFALIEEDTAMENILVPTLYSKCRKRPKEYRERILNMAEQMQIQDKLNSRVKKLSGGERQRVGVIRSMINDQQIILADEPTGALDKENSAIVMHCLKELVTNEKKAVVIVTHDLSIASQCDRIFSLEEGVLNAVEL